MLANLMYGASQVAAILYIIAGVSILLSVGIVKLSRILDRAEQEGDF
jgi:hypothetical protein